MKPKSTCCGIFIGQKGETGSGTVGFLFILAVAAGLCYFAAAHHFIMTNGGMKVYPKKALTLQDTYLDMNGMSVAELHFHEDAVTSMILQGDVQYLPGGDIIVGMVKAGRSMSDAIHRFDSDFQVIDSAREAARITGNKYQALESKYHLNEKAEAAQQKMKEGAGKLNAWLKKH